MKPTFRYLNKPALEPVPGCNWADKMVLNPAILVPTGLAVKIRPYKRDLNMFRTGYLMGMIRIRLSKPLAPMIRLPFSTSSICMS